MDWTGYTPIYVRTTGNDSNNGSSVLLAVATVQRAYDLAYINGSNKVLDIGPGTFSGVVCNGFGWGSFIGVRGAGYSSSLFGGINGEFPFSDGLSISVISDLTVNLGTIISSGAGSTVFGTSGSNGGTIQITNAVIDNCISSGGAGIEDIGSASTSDGGSGGSITLLGTHCSGSITANGGNGDYHSSNGGNGGVIVLHDSISSIITASGGLYIQYGTSGGTITLYNTTVSSHVYADGSPAVIAGGYGGNIDVYNSNINILQAKGGDGGDQGGEGGHSTVNNSVVNYIDLSPGVLNGNPSNTGIMGHLVLQGLFQFKPGTLCIAQISTDSNYHSSDILGSGLL